MREYLYRQYSTLSFPTGQGHELTKAEMVHERPSRSFVEDQKNNAVAGFGSYGKVKSAIFHGRCLMFKRG